MRPEEKQYLDDIAVKVMIERIRTLQKIPPADWKGIWQIKKE